ncbi:MAG: hypothetical protein M5U12_32530 [Verrucomicrobia bacterium]|nr:hypothetical protein [Verrucomicrobiota bacterium]
MAITVTGWGRAHDGVDDGLDTVGEDPAGVSVQVVVGEPGSLAAASMHAGVHRHADGDVRTPRPFQEFGEEPGAIEGFAVVADHEFHVELRGLEQKPQRPRVVDIVADVAVKDDRDAWLVGLRRSFRRAERGQEQATHQQGKEPAAAVGCRVTTRVEVHSGV